jgi:hypothetical protein
MAENKYKEFHMRTPVENQATAAWASMDRVDEESGVNIPDEIQVINAKEFVEENKK